VSVRETLAPREWTALDCTQMTVGANCRYKASDAKSVSGTGSRRYEYESRGRRPRSGTRVLEARPRIPAPPGRRQAARTSAFAAHVRAVHMRSSHYPSHHETHTHHVCSYMLESPRDRAHAPDGYAAASSLEERGAGRANTVSEQSNVCRNRRHTHGHTSLIISHSVFSPCLGPTPRRHRRGHSLRQSRRKIIFEYALRTGCGSDVQVSRHKCRARYGLAAGSTTCEALSTCTQGASPSSFPAVVWVPTLL